MSASTSTRPSRASGGLLASLLFLSGAVALVYEIMWQRQFALVFGSGAAAAAAVLAAYFAGLGTGAFVIGRYSQRWPRPLRAYAVLEALIAVGVLLVSPFLARFETAYPWLFRTFEGNSTLFTGVRVAVAFGALLLPTFCMGGTLPLLGAWVDRNRRELGVTAGWLYVVNTLGAALGALAMPFIFLPRWGMSGSVWVGAAINGLLAVVAWWLDRQQTDLAAPSIPQPRAATKTSARSSGELARGTILGLALVSGVVTFALQVLWNRAFAQVHENSMYSFAVIVAVVILALAVGAQVSRIALRQGREPMRLIGIAWMLGSIAVVAGPWLFLRASRGLEYLPDDGGWMGHAPQLIGWALLVVFAPMALLGVGLPALMEQAGRRGEENAARVLGRLLAMNVAGSVAGALLAGFVLPSALGLWNGMIWLGAIVLAAGVGCVGRRSRGAAVRWGILVVAAASGWPIAQLDLPRVRLAKDQGEQLVALAEGTHGITAVTERRGSRRLKLNNHYALGGTAATGDERMQAHVPLLLHPQPKRVAFLGLGTGISAGGALFHPIERVTAMELVPEVIDAARRHFKAANMGVLDDARTVVVADDARHYLRGAGEQFDVIIGDLVVPWRPGEGALFTLEQFQVAQRALSPGGVFCQWVPLFQLSEVELTILARTFLTVFPRAQVWRGDFSPTEPALALIASRDAFAVNSEVVARRLSEMRPDPANPQLSLAGVAWMNFVGVITAADLPSADPRINREDQPWIELLGPTRSGGTERSARFIGRKLQRWLGEVRKRTTDREEAFPKDVLSGMMAGEALAEMVLCLNESDQPGAAAAQARLKTLVPEATYRGLFP